MHITRNSLDTGRGPSDWFTGAVFVDTVAAPANGSRLSASNVHFTPGARTAWHTHPNGQTIWVTEGLGLCQRRGGPIEVIHPGDRVFFAGGLSTRSARRPGLRTRSDAMAQVSGFHGEWAFLSNFFPCRLTFEGQKWATSEHAFQAAKTTIPAEKEMIRLAMSPGKAKRLGAKVTLRPDWESVKIDVMREILRVKFSIEWFRTGLLLTGDWELVEGNTWHDTFWGRCNGVGENHLGRLLMEIREEVRVQSIGL